MKKKYIIMALVVVLLVYLANSNPSKGEYTDWAAKQFMKRNDVSKKLDEVQKENEEGLLGDLASAGKKLAKKYVEPQVGLLIDHYTKRDDYIFFSTYKTEFDIGGEHYKYVCVGFSKIFIPIEMPKKKTNLQNDADSSFCLSDFNGQ
ncbi:DUF4359 domain-containing protein [Bacillus shihchuchen]|uniref:DUF4359 domain-containing protein n=1 Tax=Bacillus shihchuchen TaxID=3036942 RepID=A0ABT7KR99_9BACI|nr:DUF4359 domain-containing protein [Bacillus shihchuchen]